MVRRDPVPLKKEAHVVRRGPVPLTLGRLYLRADRSIEPSKDSKRLKELTNSLFESVDLESTEFGRRLKMETGAVVQVREGSIEIIAIITTVALVIRDWPDFRDGLLALIKDVRKVGRKIRSKIMKQLKLEDKEIEASRVTTSRLMQLYGLDQRVEQGDMSAEDAHKKVLDFFELADEKVSKKESRELLAFFKHAAKQSEKAIAAPTRARGAAAASPRRRRIYRRGVQIERKPGEKNSSLSNL